MPAACFRFCHLCYTKGKHVFVGNITGSTLTWCVNATRFYVIQWNRKLHFYNGKRNKNSDIDKCDRIATVDRKFSRIGENFYINSGVFLNNSNQWKLLTTWQSQFKMRTVMPDISLQLFEKMPSQNVQEFDKIPGGNVEMSSRSVEAWNLKISRLAQSGKIEDARQVFDKMPERNVVSWNSMIAGYGQNGRLEDARQLFDEMPERNVVSWNGMIAGYLQNGRIEDGTGLFETMPERNYVSWTTMIAGLVQNGRLEDSRHLFDRMPEKHVRCWNAMIAGKEI